MRKYTRVLAVVLAPLALTFCSDNNDNGPIFNGTVQIQDNCDSATFNAGLGPGTCTGGGTTTLASFNAELNATQSVAAWRFVPAELTVREGDVIQAFNAGGERHTFTEVEEFGGGVIPALNAAAGTPIEAPECVDAGVNKLIPLGVTFTTDPETDVGVEHYQCCIHPWMRANVTVVSR